MLKPDSLRAALTAALVAVDHTVDLERDRDRLAIFIDQGRIAARSSGNPGFEWRYTLRAILTDLPAELVDVVAMAAVLWLKEHQPEALLDHQAANDAVKFDADIIDAETIDLELQLALNEAVDARPREAGGFDLVHRAEPDPAPPFDDVPPETPLRRFYLGDRLVLDLEPPE